MGFFWDSPDFLCGLWRSALSPDAYKSASAGNLVITLTRVTMKPPFIQHKRVSQFRSNEHLIECILASGHIPGIFGFHRTLFDGETHIDGAFSDCHPVIDENTIVVDSMGFFLSWRRFFSRDRTQEVHIYPRKPYSFVEMLAVFGVPGLTRCDQMMEDGYRDAQAADHLFVNRGWVKKQKKA